MAFKKKIFVGLDIIKSLIETVRASSVPIGTVVWFYGSTSNIPSGWAICDGNNGTPYLIGRYIQGSTVAGTYIPAGLPNISGGIGKYEENISGWGCLYDSGYQAHGATHHKSGGWNTNTSVIFNASRSSAIYGRSATVTPETLTMIPIMKIS